MSKLNPPPSTRSGTHIAHQAMQQGARLTPWGEKHTQIHVENGPVRGSIIIPNGDLPAPISGFVRKVLARFGIIIVLLMALGGCYAVAIRLPIH